MQATLSDQSSPADGQDHLAQVRERIVSDPSIERLIGIKAHQLCRRRDFSRSDYDDLRQDMRLHLLRKAHLFDPARGSLRTFVHNALTSWAAMELRYRGRAKRCEQFKAVSLERTPVQCDSMSAMLGDVLLERDGQRLPQNDSLSSIEQLELGDAIQHAMENLSSEDRAILIHVAEHGITSAARAFHRTRHRVLKAIARARIHFENAGLGWD
ncbi:MAG: hypothetical protein JXB13_08900 [Phycisphaerae bacterium]|nr:hypothetical protein [Phycisphaerae bacterium]